MPSDIVKADGRNPAHWKHTQEHPNEVEGALGQFNFSRWPKSAFSRPSETGPIVV